MHKVPKKVIEISEQLKSGEVSRRYRVRGVIKWFGAERRGVHIMTEIQKTLSAMGVTTDPALHELGIEDQIRFVRLPTSAAESEIASAGPESSKAAETDNAIPIESGSDGHPGDNGSSTALASEDQLEPDNDDEQPITKPDDRPVTSQSSDWTISALRDKLDRGQLDLQPRFQREYVWSLKPELPSRLIESLLLEIPIPPIYFGKVSDEQ